MSRTRREPRAWQRMLSGRRLDLLDPSPLDIEIEDIAHGLSRVARWNGQTHGPHAFSVAQHSLVVCDIVAKWQRTDPAFEMLVLLHDAPEYVIGDMISPFKAVVGGGYKAVEQRLQAAIHLRFALPAEVSVRTKKAIKKADLAAAWFEAVHLAGFSEREADDFFGRPQNVSADDLALAPLSVAEAQAAYLERFEALEYARDRAERRRA